jgi:Tol biopolymer transport system component
MSLRRWLLLATALATALGVSSASPAPASERVGAPAGEIVFASDRASANPGEVYALAPGAARRNLSRSPYADVALATSPKGRAFAFWSNRAGPWRLMIAPDGTALRSVAVGGRGGAEYPPAPPVFSADGTQLLIPYLARDSITQRPRYAIARVRSGPARGVTTPCGSSPVLSPDGLLIACPVAGDRVSVADLRGDVRFTVPGRSALWSPDGTLAVAGEKRTEVLSSTGRSIAGLSGVARAWSPDGSTLALARPGELTLARPGRAGAAHVVYEGGSGTPYWVAFTPDGRTVVFAGGFGNPQMAPVAGGRVRAFAGQAFGSWSRGGRYAYTVAVGGSLRILIGDQLARKARLVARLPFDEKGVSRLAWLGDGSALLYNGSAPARADLWTMEADGSAQRRLTGTFRTAQPAWSHDGTRIAYASGDATGGSSIVVADASGRKLEVVAGGASGQAPNDGHPTWSPDGTRIALDDIVTAGAFVVDVASGRRTGLAVDGVSPAWSPDGGIVAFVDIDDRTVWGANPIGADRRRLLPPSAGKVMSIAWSPDGERLAFSTAAGVYMAAPGGVGSPKLVIAARNPGRPSFSPDGTRIAFAADAGTIHPYRAVSVVGVDGSERKQLTTGPYDSTDPAWRSVTP